MADTNHVDATTSSGSDLEVAGITSPASSLSPLGVSQAPISRRRTAGSPAWETRLSASVKHTDVGGDWLPQLMVLSVELLASASGRCLSTCRHHTPGHMSTPGHGLTPSSAQV